MNTAQQQDIQRILTAYQKSDDTQRPQWREIASYVYANALRDEEISAFDLHTAFKPLAHIAASAGFVENAEAVGSAIVRPVEDAVAAARTGRAWAATALHLLRIQHEPLYQLHQLRDGFMAMTTSVEQWAGHATGALSMEERQRLAGLYELPHAQRLQALHDVTLHDTATMVGIGTLPGLFPKAATSTEAALSGAAGSMARDAQLPMQFPDAQEGALALAGTNATADAPYLQNVMAMTSPPPGYDHPPEVSPNKAAANPDAPRANTEVPDEIMRFREIYMLDDASEALSRHLSAIRVLDGKKKIELYAQEIKLIDDYTNHMLNPHIVQTDAEYQQVMAGTRALVSHVSQSEMHRALAEGVDPSQALAQSREPIRLFEQMVPWLEARRKRNLADLSVEEAEYAHMKVALQDPDAVGYQRTVSPRSITERELHHADYWERLWQDVGKLADHLQLLGLHEQADNVLQEVRAMIRVKLDDSMAQHQQRMADFMAIGQQARAVDVGTLSGQGYTQRGFESIRDGIDTELQHLRGEIAEEREYFIRDQLWRWRHTEENRVRDSAHHATLRESLFGDTAPGQAAGPER